MATLAKLLVRVVLVDADGDERREVEDVREIADVVGENGKRETVSLSNGFTALSPPSGAALCVIRRLTGALTLTLKGVTGDTGIVMQSGTLDTKPIVIPLGTAPSIGIAANGSGTVEVLWL